MRQRVGNRFTTFLSLLLSFILYACSTPGGMEGAVDTTEVSPGNGVFIKSVPFYPQKRYMCGPAALASVLNFYGENLRLEEVERALFIEKLRTTLMMDMLIYTKERGLKARYFKGTLVELKSEIRAGRPVILLVDLGLAEFPSGHYIVAVGFNDEEDAIIAHTGTRGRDAISYEKLIWAWRKGGYQALSISPAEEYKGSL